MYAKLYKTDGSVEDIKPANGKDFKLKEIQEMVEGVFQLVSLPSGKIILVNDEGRLIGLPPNPGASLVWQKEFPIDKYPDNNDGLIVGNAIVCDEELVK